MPSTYYGTLGKYEQKSLWKNPFSVGSFIQNILLKIWTLIKSKTTAISHDHKIDFLWLLSSFHFLPHFVKITALLLLIWDHFHMQNFSASYSVVQACVLSSSAHPTGFLWSLGQETDKDKDWGTGMAKAKPWFCGQCTIFVLILIFTLDHCPIGRFNRYIL